MPLLQGHSATYRFNIHLLLVIKKSICQVVGRRPHWLIRLLAHYKQLKWLQWCVHSQRVYPRNYLHIIHVYCLIRDRDLAQLPQTGVMELYDSLMRRCRNSINSTLCEMCHFHGLILTRSIEECGSKQCLHLKLLILPTH